MEEEEVMIDTVAVSDSNGAGGSYNTLIYIRYNRLKLNWPFFMFGCYHIFSPFFGGYQIGMITIPCNLYTT